MKRTRILNDPSDLVPLIDVFSNTEHRQVYDLLTESWYTKVELDQHTGKDTRKSLDTLQHGLLLESKWRMPTPGESPEMEFHTSFTSIRVGFQCSITELAEVVDSALTQGEQLRKDAERLEDEVRKGNYSLTYLSRTLDASPNQLKCIAKRYGRISVKGQRLEVLEER